MCLVYATVSSSNYSQSQNLNRTNKSCIYNSDLDQRMGEKALKILTSPPVSTPYLDIFSRLVSLIASDGTIVTQVLKRLCQEFSTPFLEFQLSAVTKAVTFQE